MNRGMNTWKTVVTSNAASLKLKWCHELCIIVCYHQHNDDET